MTVLGDHLSRKWFVAARSKRVGQSPLRVMFFDNPIVLARDPKGGIFALEDRCPHRGVPLSAGRQTTEGLACRYHGWTFGADGRCTAMPGAPGSTPVADVRVPCFSVTERDGLVWISRNPDSGLPERILAMNPAHRRFLWQDRWKAPVIDVQENFLDALHTHTVHPGIVRRARERRRVDVRLERAGDGFHVDYSGQAEQSGLLFRLFESRRTRERAYVSDVSVAQLEYRYAAGWAAWITLCFTPETPRSTHVFATLHVEGRWAPKWLIRALVWPFIRHVARQDQRIVELQASSSQHFPTLRPVVTTLDVVRPYLDAAWSGRSDGMPRTCDISLEL